MKKGYCVNTNGGLCQELHMITRIYIKIFRILQRSIIFIWGLIMKQGYYVSTIVAYHYL